jgi:hypothetical protein
MSEHMTNKKNSCPYRESNSDQSIRHKLFSSSYSDIISNTIMFLYPELFVLQYFTEKYQGLLTYISLIQTIIHSSQVLPNEHHVLAYNSNIQAPSI